MRHAVDQFGSTERLALRQAFCVSLPTITLHMKRYDRAYFDRWYRDPRRRVKTPADIARGAALVLGVAEYLLGRPVRRVLDVGCGEGGWRQALRRDRPALRYTGVDPSEYVVRRFGKRRNILLGSFGNLDELELDGPFDVIICADMLNYVPTPELVAGLGHVSGLLGGIAYLQVYASRDGVEGDRREWHDRPAARYRKLFRDAGLTACGLHCYASEQVAGQMTALERR